MVRGPQFEKRWSRLSIIQHRIFTRTSVSSISLCKTYNWAELGVPDSAGSSVPHDDVFFFLASCSSIWAFSLSDAPKDENIKMLLQDLTLNKNIWSINNCLNS